MHSPFDRRPPDPAAAQALVLAELLAWLDQEPDAELAREIRALQLHTSSLMIAEAWHPPVPLLVALVERLDDAAQRLRQRPQMLNIAKKLYKRAVIARLLERDAQRGLGDAVARQHGARTSRGACCRHRSSPMFATPRRPDPPRSSERISPHRQRRCQ